MRKRIHAHLLLMAGIVLGLALILNMVMYRAAFSRQVPVRPPAVNSPREPSSTASLTLPNPRL